MSKNIFFISPKYKINVFIKKIKISQVKNEINTLFPNN